MFWRMDERRDSYLANPVVGIFSISIGFSLREGISESIVFCFDRKSSRKSEKESPILYPQSLDPLATACFWSQTRTRDSKVFWSDLHVDLGFVLQSVVQYVEYEKQYEISACFAQGQKNTSYSTSKFVERRRGWTLWATESSDRQPQMTLTPIALLGSSAE